MSEVIRLECHAGFCPFIPATFSLNSTGVKVSAALNNKGHFILLEPDQLLQPTHGQPEQETGPTTIAAIINGLPHLRRAMENAVSPSGAEVLLRDVCWLDILGQPVDDNAA